MKRQQQYGFTLVEVAIVLVIVGLLLGGVLKGQEIINSAKAKAVINDFRNTATMMAAYQDRYRYWPGDDPAADKHLSSSAVVAPQGNSSAPGNGKIEGEWDSQTPTDESVIFWQHLRLANLASGDVDKPSAAASVGDWLPKNAEGGRFGVSSTRPTSLPVAIRGRFFICQGNLDGRIARQVDTALDDGRGTTGSVGIFSSGAADATGESSPQEGQLYVVCYGI